MPRVGYATRLEEELHRALEDVLRVVGVRVGLHDAEAALAMARKWLACPRDYRPHDGLVERPDLDADIPF